MLKICDSIIDIKNTRSELLIGTGAILYKRLISNVYCLISKLVHSALCGCRGSCGVSRRLVFLLLGYKALGGENH